jgi:hypothetical protein
MLALQPFGDPIRGINSTPLQIDSPVALTGLILATAVFIFIRLRTRETRVVAILSAETISLPLIAHNLWNTLGTSILICLAIVAILFFIIPNRLESIIGHDYAY